MLDPQHTIRPNQKDVAAKVIDGETIILNVSNSNYYSTVGVGSAIWEMISVGRSLEYILNGVAQLYDVPMEQARHGVTRFIDDLLIEELVIAYDEAPSSHAEPDETDQEKSVYEPPQLEKYSDMADLLALDPPTPGLTDINWNPDHADLTD